MKKCNVRRAVARLVASACASLGAHAATPSDSTTEASWELVVAPFTHHWHKDAEHRRVVLLGLERIAVDGSTVGGALFRNSYGQLSGYAYYGHEWDELLGSNSLYVKLSGGIIYGYRGRFKNKVPLNVGASRRPSFRPLVGA